MAAACRFMLLPLELRLSVYRKVFHNFLLQIADEENFAAYNLNPEIAPNQLRKTNKLIRRESIPVLASCTRVIAAPILLPYKDGQADTSVKPRYVQPRLNGLFSSNIQALSISLQSAWIPDHGKVRNLKRIAIDAWLFAKEPTKVKKDTDLVKMVTLHLGGSGFAEDIYPGWLEDLLEEKRPSVKLALQEVWKVDEDDSELSYLVSGTAPIVDSADYRVNRKPWSM